MKNKSFTLFLSGALLVAGLLLSGCQLSESPAIAAAAPAEIAHANVDMATRIHFQDQLAERGLYAVDQAVASTGSEMSIADRIRFHDRLLADGAISMAERIQFHDRLWAEQPVSDDATVITLADRIHFHDRLDEQGSVTGATGGWSMDERIRFKDNLAENS